MKIIGEHDERYVALLSKCLMAGGEDGLFNAGGVDVGAILKLRRFSELARQFAESDGVAFKFDGGKVTPTSTGRRFRKLVNAGCGEVDEIYKLEPYSQLIVSEVNWPLLYKLLSHLRLPEHSLKISETLNEIADRIREKARSPAFRAKLNSYHRSSNKNYRELVKYEQALFDRYSRILVLRLDLSYQKEHSSVSQSLAFQHRKRLFDNARSNSLFKNMLGYVTKLEHGVEKGFHFHCIFFFDGAKVREDITLAKRIGEYWVSVITRGIGGYYNCNYAKEKYRRCGIGVVNYYDLDKREGLRLAIVYLTKTDLYMKLKAEGRALTRGIMPDAPSGRGRPRTVVLPN